MAVTTTIDSTLGVVSKPDTSSTAGTVTISGLQASVIALTTAATISAAQAGAFTFGNGGAPVTYVMPLASSCPGAVFTFRSVTAQANALTCSQEANGTKAFTDGTLTGQGSKVAVANIIGSSMSLLSDGASFLVIGNSGSLAFSGT
jgi:hypothetical protein